MTYYGQRTPGIGCQECNWTGYQEAADERRHYSWPCECRQRRSIEAPNKPDQAQTERK